MLAAAAVVVAATVQLQVPALRKPNAGAAIPIAHAIAHAMQAACPEQA